jgi:hypothetical protein
MSKPTGMVAVTTILRIGRA